MPRTLVLMLLAFAVVLGVRPAAAQSPPPIGVWLTADKSERFTVSSNGYCEFYAVQHGTNAVSQIVGNCGWNASGAGGIMTIMNTNNYIPAPIYYNIVWVDRRTIRIYGDVFYLMGPA